MRLRVGVGGGRDARRQRVRSQTHRLSIWASRWARSPPLSMTRSACGHPLLAGDLLGDASPGVGLRPSPDARTSRSTATSTGRVDDDDRRRRRWPPATVSSGVSSTTTWSGAVLGGDAPAISAPHGRVDEAVEVRQRRVVVEGDRRQAGPVERPVGADDARSPKRSASRPQQRRAAAPAARGRCRRRRR